MEFIGGVLAFVSVLALVGSILGLIKPSIIKQSNRKQVLKIMLISFVLFVVGMIIAVTADSEDSAVSNSRINTLKISETDTNVQKEKKQVKKIDFSVVKQKANNGDKEAQFELGVAYYTGKGIEWNKNKAFKWFEKSANQGHAVAQQNLGAMYSNGEGVEASHKKAVKALNKAIALGSKEAQALLNKISRLYYEKQSTIVNVLSAIYSDMATVERRFKAFSTVLSSGDITGAIRNARRDEDWLRQFTYKSYIPKVGKSYKNIDNKNTIKIVENLIKYSQTSNLRLQIYYDNFIEYVDNQKPSLLVKVQDSLDSYQSVKLLVVSNSFVLGEKYNLGYDDYLNHWRTKSEIEADKTKREDEQKEAKKNKSFIDSNKYRENSAEYALAKFITAWQYRDFKDMAKYTQTSWRERESSPHGDLANSYDFKYLTSAKLGESKCKRSLCNVSISIAYKNSFNDKIETHTIKPNVIKENGKWGVNPISALREY